MCLWKIDKGQSACAYMSASLRYSVSFEHQHTGSFFFTMAQSTVKLASGYQMPLVGFGLWKVPANQAADTVYNVCHPKTLGEQG